MTTYQYSALRSEIVDFLMAPIFVLLDKDKLEWELPISAKEVLGTAYDDLFQIGQDLADLKAKVTSTYLMHKATPLAFYLYQLVLKKGIEPQSIDQALDVMASLSRQEMVLALELTLDYRGNKKEAFDLSDYLEEEVLKADERWYWYQAFRQPEATLEMLVAILRQVADRYRPYYVKYQTTCQEYARTMDMAKTLSELGVVEVDEIIASSEDIVDVYLLTPSHVRFSFMSSQEETLTVNAIFFSVFVDQVIGATARLDVSGLVTILKQVADESRYQVLQALANGETKSKSIAEQLGITPAAVSFHTQKLLNSQLLVVNTEGKGVKYLLNKPLLQEMITKLTDDFQLTNKP